MKKFDRDKLLKANKVYLTEQDSDGCSCFEIRIQLPTNDYVQIDLSEPFPSEIIYQSLAPGGFKYNPEKDIPITIHGKTQSLEILKNSSSYKNNNSDTVQSAIDLISEMKGLIYR